MCDSFHQYFPPFDIIKEFLHCSDFILYYRTLDLTLLKTIFQKMYKPYDIVAVVHLKTAIQPLNPQELGSLSAYLSENYPNDLILAGYNNAVLDCGSIKILRSEKVEPNLLKYIIEQKAFKVNIQQ